MKISVIVPVYNVENYLGKCLNSLVNQTLQEIEILVVNDGSTDNSQKIIEVFQSKFPQEKVNNEDFLTELVRTELAFQKLQNSRPPLRSADPDWETIYHPAEPHSSDPSYRDWETDRKSTRLNSSHRSLSRMPSSA